jgi:hypothetical protein
LDYLPGEAERNGDRGPKPKRLTIPEENIKVSDYMLELERDQWEEIKVRHTAKGSLKGLLHFKQVYILNKNKILIERRLLVVGYAEIEVHKLFPAYQTTARQNGYKDGLV